VFNGLKRRTSNQTGKIWIDLDNSPHVPFFNPIIDELHSRGFEVFLTARDCFQVCELVEQFNLRCHVVGRHYGANRLLKVFGTIMRAWELFLTVRHEKLVLAMSHGSRAQRIVCAALGIPLVVIIDYEHTKGSLPFTRPTRLIVPEVAVASFEKNGARSIVAYPGIKEDVYVPNFSPDPKILEELRLSGSEIIVTVRPPATEAHYHNKESELLFEAAMKRLVEHSETKVVLLPRSAKQRMEIRERWSKWLEVEKIIIPNSAVNGLNLIYFSDLVISGGGTMNREAAALEVPVYSIFRGPIGAVDRYLANTGQLVLLETVDDTQTKLNLKRREREYPYRSKNRCALHSIVDATLDLLPSKEHRPASEPRDRPEATSRA